MNWLDMRTVIFGHLITDVLGVMVVLFLWRQNRGRYRGISLWAAGFALQTAGTLLIIFRGIVPDWVSMTLANVLVLAGMAAVVIGLYRFVGAVRPLAPDLVLLVSFAAVSLYFAEFRPSLEIRNIAVSLAFAGIAGSMSWFWTRLRPDLRKLMARIGHIYIAIAAVSLLRVVFTLFNPPSSEDFFRSGVVDTLALLFYQAVFILLIYDLALMVNERLIEELRLQEDKYSKAFRSAPYAIILTDTETGRIFEVNDGFVRISGYSREEAVGKTTFDLRLWEHDEDRRKAIAALSTEGKVFEQEHRFRRKSGEMITGLWSAEVILINDRPCVFASINDITLRKRALESLNETVREKELLMSELKHRVKNSLAVVSSLLGLSREASSDPGVKTVLSDLRTRVGSMSSVYEQLDWADRVDFVQLRPYFLNLAESLAKSYGPTDGRIRITSDLSDLAVETKKAFPLGLILNELILNSYKYAYPDGRAGEIHVELKSVTGGMCLTVSDDGIGRGEGRVTTGGGGMGSSLVETLADQIGARVSRPPGPGTTVVVLF